MKTSTAAQCPALANLGTGVLSKCKKNIYVFLDLKNSKHYTTLQYYEKI